MSGAADSPGHWIGYIRRSYKRDGAPDVSDENQESTIRMLIPTGASVEFIRDSGGHRSSSSDDRDGYREFIRRVAEGGVAGIAVYKLDRLNRSVRLMSSLKDLLDRNGVRLAAGDIPASQSDSAAGRLMLHIMVAAAQYQRDVDSERMVAQMRWIFEAGGHRGNDPFGYRTARDAEGKVAQPRTLEVVPEEAEVVRHVFRLLAKHPFSEIADILNREGVRHRATRAWGKNAVKDLWRRREVYRGNVVTRRGVEILPGNHPPILTPEEFRDAAAGVDRRVRRRGVREPLAKRFYLLGGLMFCSGGTKMHGTAQKSRGKEWLYYVCPVSEKRRARFDDESNLVACHARRVRAD